MSVKPIPEGYHSVTPYLIVDDAARALDFYTRALGATELFRMTMPAQSAAAGGVEGGDRIGHAEFKIGDSHVMLADEAPEMGHRSPRTLGGTATSLMVYLPDVDTVFERAIAAGARQERPVENQFYGDRSGSFVDPFGHKWMLATHIEDVSPEEMQKRMAKMTPEKADA